MFSHVHVVVSRVTCTCSRVTCTCSRVTCTYYRHITCTCTACVHVDSFPNYFAIKTTPAWNQTVLDFIIEQSCRYQLRRKSLRSCDKAADTITCVVSSHWWQRGWCSHAQSLYHKWQNYPVPERLTLEAEDSRSLSLRAVLSLSCTVRNARDTMSLSSVTRSLWAVRNNTHAHCILYVLVAVMWYGK